MTFGEAVQHFLDQGFEADLGPGPGEITLARKQACGLTSYSVVPIEQLVGMAEISVRVRVTNALFDLAIGRCKEEGILA